MCVRMTTLAVEPAAVPACVTMTTSLRTMSVVSSSHTYVMTHVPQ